MAKTGTYRWSKYTQRFLPLNEWFAEKAAHEVPVARSDVVGCPMIISDCMEMRSMVDGQVYTSKRAYEQSVKAAGCAIVGGDSGFHSGAYCAPKFDDKKLENDIAQDVKTSLEQVRAGYHEKVRNEPTDDLIAIG
jgi:hypothetical protein